MCGAFECKIRSSRIAQKATTDVAPFFFINGCSGDKQRWIAQAENPNDVILCWI